MPNIRISRGISEELFLELKFVLRYLAEKLKSKGVEFALTRLKEEVVPFSGSSIFIYGFSDADSDEKEELAQLLKVLRNNFAIPIFPVKSSCVSVGEVEKKSPYLQVLCGPKDDYFEAIKRLKLGYDVEFHLVNSNIPLDNLADTYVEIILTPNEAQLFGQIVDEFLNTSLSKRFLWPKIIMRFVSVDELN